MNTQSSLQNQENELRMFAKKVSNSMISTIDRKRIVIFVAVTYGITIALALGVLFTGGIYVSYPLGKAKVAVILLAATMFVPAIGNIATRLIFLSPRALAPVDRAISKNTAALEKAADQAELGAVS